MDTSSVIALVILSIYPLVSSSKFILAYLRLKRNGAVAVGTITGYLPIKYIMLKNALLPNISFTTTDHQKINGSPIHSSLVEVILYRLNDQHYIYYNKNNPRKFIVAKPNEFYLNIIVIAAFLVMLIIAAVNSF